MESFIYQMASISGGYRVNEDGTITRIDENGNTNDNNLNPNDNRNNKNRRWVWLAVIAAVLIALIVAFILSDNDSDYYSMADEAVDFEDTTVVMVEEADEEAYSSSVSTTYLYLSVHSLNVPSSGGAYDITINTDGDWYVSAETDNWGSISTYENSLTVRLSPNSSPSSRTDYFEITSGGLTRRVNIYQQGDNSPKADIERIWIDHDVYQGNQYGMRIHVRFTVDNMKGKDVYVKAHFYYGDNVTPLLDRYGDDLVVSDYGTANYDDSIFEDFKIFVPYTRLNMEEGIGSIKLSFDISISTSNGTQLTRRNNTGIIFTG